MKRLRTVEDLEDRLDQGLAWRKRELSIIRGMVQNQTASTPKSEFVIRSGVAMLYAHWEGFIKESSELYAHFVASQRLAYADLSSNFLALAMKKQLHEAEMTSKATRYSKVAEFFLSGLNSQCRISYAQLIDTQANLSSAVLREIVCMLGLSYSYFETKEKLIDERLVSARNHVAHGEHLVPDIEGFLELHQEILTIMEVFRNQISNAAAMGLYRRTDSQSSVA